MKWLHHICGARLCCIADEQTRCTPKARKGLYCGELWWHDGDMTETRSPVRIKGMAMGRYPLKNCCMVTQIWEKTAMKPRKRETLYDNNQSHKSPPNDELINKEGKVWNNCTQTISKWLKCNVLMCYESLVSKKDMDWMLWSRETESSHEGRWSAVLRGCSRPVWFSPRF